jgi:1-acyl-sn-glycerol-3-phosphate acyltransferase
MRLRLDALQRRFRESMRRSAALLFAVWLWTVFGIGAALAAAAALLPARVARKRVARAIASAGLRLSGLPIHVQGQPALQDGPRIFVSNHASYLDWLILTAVLPARACFVAKRELAQSTPLKWMLDRMGVRFVERDEVHASIEDAGRLVEAAKAGESLVYFPEGTLARAPGLRPFHMGAFVAAAQAGVAVVPVSLRGTRSVLRDGSWWPRRGPIAVQLHEPLGAQGATWSDALRLRDRVRERIARGCLEPVMAA